MSRVVVAIPPLAVPDRFIDNPAFAFLPALLWAATAGEFHDVRVDNALLSGAPLLRTPLGWLAGGEPAAYWNRLSSIDTDHLVIAWSSYHRRADPEGATLPRPGHPLWSARQASGRQIHLAEFWHAESRFEPLRNATPVGQGLELATCSVQDTGAQLDLRLGITRPAGDSALRPTWLTPAALRAMAALDPIVRTGAADGAVESHPEGQGHRREARFFPVLTSMGCSYRCLFCHKPGPAATWRPRPMAAVKAELETLARAGARLVFVLDPIANYDAAHFTAVIDALASRGLAAVFPNGLAVSHLTVPLLERLRTVASDLVVSVESGSVRTLATLRKPVELAQAEHMLAEAHKLGFNTSAHFIVGVPGETQQEAAATLGLAVRLHENYGVVPSIQRYVPPGQSDGGAFDAAAAETRSAAGAPAVVASRQGGRVEAEVAALWVRERARSKATPKIIINVSYACNNHCSFCAVADRPRLHGLLDEQVRLLREAREQGIRHVDIDGGEPTLYPGLSHLLQTATELGYERINVTTNGRRLCYPEFAEKLAQFKNLELCVSMHGPDAATHEALTRVPGSFHQTLTGLHNAARAGLDVALNITVVAANVARIRETVMLGVLAGAKRVSIQRYTPFGAPDSAFEPPLEPLMDQIASIRAELPLIPLSLVNFCACEVGPHAHLAAGDQAKSVRTMQFVDLRELPLASWLAARRRHLDVCADCLLREVCPGKWVIDGEEAAQSDELIDFTPGLSCRTRCRFCAVPEGHGPPDLNTDAATQMLERLSPRRPARLRISGGEPTDREDLPVLIAKAAELGYQAVSVQSHGLRFADRSYLSTLVRAGLREVRISVFGASDEDYHAVAGVRDGFTRLLQGVANAVLELGTGVGVDVLAIRPLLPNLEATVRKLAALGVRDALLWLPAYEGRAAAPGGEELVPTLREASAPFQSALALQDELAGLRVRSIYAPLCMLGAYADRSLDVRRANVLIVNPGAVLPMHRCAVDLGMYPPRCEACTRKSDCLGLRPSYFERHGDDEVEPLLHAPAGDRSPT